MSNTERILALENAINELRGTIQTRETEILEAAIRENQLREDVRVLQQRSTPSHVTKNLAVKPEPFDGTNYKDFIRTVHVFLSAHGDAYHLSSQKILFVLSLMRGGLAGEWAQNYVDSKTVAGTLTINDTWNTFLESLKTTFGDPNEAMHAQTALIKLKQSGAKAEEFFAQFDVHRRKAGYMDGYDDFLIRLLEMALDSSIVQNILSMSECPITYEGWKTAALRFDNQRRRLQDVMRTRQQPMVRRPLHAPPRAPYAPPPVAPQFRPPPGPPPVTDKRDQTGVTFGGQGQPMEITMDRARRNNLCYLCNRPGHIARNCPSRTLKIREIIQKMDPEECADWNDQFRAMEHRTESELAAGYWDQSDQLTEEHAAEAPVDGQQDFTSPQA